MQDGKGETPARTDLSDAVDAARTLLARLADDLDGRADAVAHAAADALRVAQPALDRLATAGPDAEAGVDPDPASGPVLILDVSDLLGYFAHNRLPTGIQRVQAELIYHILSTPGNMPSRLCCFVEARDIWVAVSTPKFLDLCTQSRTGGDPQEPRWRAAVDGLRAELDASPALAFPRGAVLANVGSSWWLSEYFFHVRQAKLAYGIRYVPLIHDLIPILMPEMCAVELVQEFVAWFIGVLGHADFYFAVSESTKRDLIALAATMGHTIASERVRVIGLNADFRPLGIEHQVARAPNRIDEPFVLFVSTLETRKNQLGAMDAWSALVAKHGAEKVPRLVMVGKRGFQSDVVLARVDHNIMLRERVTLLSGVDDGELQTLYRNCLFTIYPSFYEGWGLPVTESLCYGKVPVVAENSSLTQAGDRFAVYFETGSTAAFVTALERMLFEPGFRQRCEQRIRDEFKPGTWADAADRLTGGVTAFVDQADPAGSHVPAAEPGFFYPLKLIQSTRVWRGSGSAEIYRTGPGWYKIEAHGCWIKPAGAELAMRVPTMRRGRVGLELFCAPKSDVRYRIDALGTGVVTTGAISDWSRKWVFLDLDTLPADGILRIWITAAVAEQPQLGWNGDFRPLTIGVGGFFLFGDDDRPSRLDFVEAAALGALDDFDRYRDRSLAVEPGRTAASLRHEAPAT